VGEADGFKTVLLLNPVEGAQLYVFALLLALSVVLPPLHIVTFEPAVTVGGGLTVTVTLALEEHPALVTVTVYVVVVVGLAEGLETVVLLNPVDGLQLYEVPPLAVSVTLPLLQITGALGLMLALGKG
jgi:hypothetical protein